MDEVVTFIILWVFLFSKNAVCPWRWGHSVALKQCSPYDTALMLQKTRIFSNTTPRTSNLRRVLLFFNMFLAWNHARFLITLAIVNLLLALSFITSLLYLVPITVSNIFWSVTIVFLTLKSWNVHQHHMKISVLWHPFPPSKWMSFSIPNHPCYHWKFKIPTPLMVYHAYSLFYP